MNHRLSFSALTLLLWLVISCAPQTERTSLVSRVDSLLETVPDFSGVVLLADDGRVLYERAFGFRNREQNVPLDTADIFELASVSKQFTAMVIMMLAEEGRLTYDDSLTQYIPSLPYHGVTIRHLLTHTSGLPDYQEVMDQYWDKTKVAGNDDNIAYLIRYHPASLFQPGEKYTYSNTGYMLLATIAERASGEDFIDICRQRIFQPLGMNDTDFRTPADRKAIDRFTSGYLYVAEKDKYVNADSFPAFNYTLWLGNRKGPGRISSTAHDLLTWDRALYTDRLVKQATLADAFAPMTLSNDSISNYGFGWVLSRDSLLGRVVSHTGSNPGYRTEIVRYIDADKTIIFLNNNDHEKKAAMMDALKALIRKD